MRTAEALVALTVGFLLLMGGGHVLARTAAAGRVLVASGERLEAQRLAVSVLESELAGARPGEDWSPHADGLALRAYRGWGRACGPNSDTEVVVVYRGLRNPDAAKDSLELVTATGTTRRVMLAGSNRVEPADAPGCPGTAHLERLWWDAPDPGAGAAWRWPPGQVPVLVRVFERGLYGVNDAFRYRRGAGGRQPLTASALDPDKSWLGVRDGVPLLTLSTGPSDVLMRWWTW